MPPPKQQQQEQSPTATTAPIIRKHKFPTPLLRLSIHDLAHEGASIFLSHIHGNEDLETQVQNVLNLLYHSPTESSSPSSNTSDIEDAAKTHCPGTRSVTFIIRPFPGVAYTTGSDLDDDHKEINLSASYVVKCARGSDKRRELLGVICHELVHCFQWSAGGTCPGGLIEGIADWVRLRAGLGAAHWKQEAGGEWDGGYQKTGYFLEWLEGRFGEGTVRGLNARLRVGRYEEERVFGECCRGRKVGELWEEYREELRKRDDCDDGDGPANPIPTHAVGGE